MEQNKLGIESKTAFKLVFRRIVEHAVCFETEHVVVDLKIRLEQILVGIGESELDGAVLLAYRRHGFSKQNRITGKMKPILENGNVTLRRRIQRIFQSYFRQQMEKIHWIIDFGFHLWRIVGQKVGARIEVVDVDRPFLLGQIRNRRCDIFRRRTAEKPAGFGKLG